MDLKNLAHALAVLAALAILAVSAQPVPPGVPLIPREVWFDSGDYLEALRRTEQMRASSADDPTAAQRREFARGHLRLLKSMMGDLEATSVGQAPAAAGSPLAQQQVRALLGNYQMADAVDAIARQARDRQVVIINEAHDAPSHRAFAHLLAARLRGAGFDYLACEAFLSVEEMQVGENFPTRRTGLYTSEPFFGDFVRSGARMGFKLVSYEMIPDAAYPHLQGSARINAREAAQATHLVERIFNRDPRARVLIFVGHGHLSRREVDRSDGLKVRMMAARLKEATGIEPLAIDQTLWDVSHPSSHERRLLEEIGERNGERRAVVMRARRDPNSFLVAGRYAGDVDIQVFHPRSRTVEGRPDWVLMEGYRRPVAIPKPLLPADRRRLVQAFHEEDAEDGIPVDQVLVEPGMDPPSLMLPKGAFRLTFRE